MTFKTKFFNAVICAVMLAGFTACESVIDKETLKQEILDELRKELNNNSGTNGTGNENNGENNSGDSTQTPDPNYKFAIVLMDENLNGATATLSQKGANAFTDEVTLTITPNFEIFWWAETLTLEIINAQNSDLKETDGVYTCKLTSFADNTTIKVSGLVTGTIHGHDYVDLGLPSGVLWATCNVGATSPEEYGDYFAWGEVTTKETFNGSTYKFATNVEEKYDSTYFGKYYVYDCTKYGTVDNKTVLDLEDDAAHVNWGGDWRMPTLAEQQELRTECTWTWTDNYNSTGKAGYIVLSKAEGNGNSIFLPAAGFRAVFLWRGSEGLFGYYWSSSLSESNPNDAYYLYFRSDKYKWSRGGRCDGLSVRAVCSSK